MNLPQLNSTQAYSACVCVCVVLVGIVFEDFFPLARLKGQMLISTEYS